MSSAVELPYLCLRALVLFPGQSADLAVGRDESKTTILAAQERFEGRLVTVSQKRAEQESNIASEDLYSVGMICAMEASVDLSGIWRVHVTGRERARLSAFTLTNGVQMVTATPLNPPDYNVADWNTKSRSVLADLERRIFERTPDMEDLFRVLSEERSVDAYLSNSLELIKRNTKFKMKLPTNITSLMPEDPEIQSIINELCAVSQAILEERDPLRQLEALERLVTKI